MSGLVNETAEILANEQVGPQLYLMTLRARKVAERVAPGQFIHMKVPGMEDHLLRRPFSVYAKQADAGTVDVLYQLVGYGTRMMAALAAGACAEVIGPVGNTWEAHGRVLAGEKPCMLLVGGGVGAAPLYLLAEELVLAGCRVDVVLGAQTKESLVCRARYESLLGENPLCATDDGSYGRPGFCTSLVQERLQQGCRANGAPYDQVVVCGPEPLMRIVAGMCAEQGVPCQVSLERRMACGIGACLSCVVQTVNGMRRSCVDGPVFDAQEVIW